LFEQIWNLHDTQILIVHQGFGFVKFLCFAFVLCTNVITNCKISNEFAASTNEFPYLDIMNPFAWLSNWAPSALSEFEYGNGFVKGFPVFRLSPDYTIIVQGQAIILLSGNNLNTENPFVTKQIHYCIQILTIIINCKQYVIHM
jgi:hypothetical protein